MPIPKVIKEMAAKQKNRMEQLAPLARRGRPVEGELYTMISYRNRSFSSLLLLLRDLLSAMVLCFVCLLQIFERPQRHRLGSYSSELVDINNVPWTHGGSRERESCFSLEKRELRPES